MTNSISLDLLPVGAQARVVSIAAQGSTRRRLLDLGLVPGTQVKTLRYSPSGDPTAYRIRGAVIALRQRETEKILVQPARE